MIITTTQSIQGRRITAYHGVVVGEAIMGANVVRDLFAGITDIIGGRSGAYEQKLADARQVAFEEIEERRRQAGRRRHRRCRSRLRSRGRQHADGLSLRHRCVYGGSIMRQSAIYGAVVAAAVFFIGFTTGMGGSLIADLIFSALMGVFAAVLFAAVKKYANRSRN